jgi:predicted TIM-barrel fold metal-dependent hydrolase
MYPAYAKCAELHVPVMIHGNNELAWTLGWPSFDDVLIIATDFPELKVVAACDCWPSVDEIRRLLDRCENIYFALDANPRRDLLPEVSALLNSDRGRTRCVWGSNACAWEQTTKQVEQLALEDDAESHFVRDNAVALFALEQQRRPRLEAELILTGE